MMVALCSLVASVVNIFIWMLIASVVLSWLVQFNILNRQNRFVYLIGDFLYRITEPLLRPIRKFLPNLGGIDISPVVLILALVFLENLVLRDLMGCY